MTPSAGTCRAAATGSAARPPSPRATRRTRIGPRRGTPAAPRGSSVRLAHTGSGNSHRRPGVAGTRRTWRPRVRGPPPRRSQRFAPGGGCRVRQDGQRRRRDQRVTAGARSPVQTGRPRESFLNASTETMMNVADAMSATGSRLRAGRWAAPRKARRASARQPWPVIGRGMVAAEHDAPPDSASTTSSSVPAPKNPSTFGIAPAAEAATISTAASERRGGTTPSTRARLALVARDSSTPASSARGELPREAAKRPDDGAERRHDPDANARAKRAPGDVQVHAFGADGADPPRSQAGHERSAVGQRAGHTEQASDRQEDRRLRRGRCASAWRPGTRRP